MRNALVIIAGFVVVTCAVYGQSVGHEFISWDDDINIYENPYVNSGSLEGLGDLWRESYIGLYIPLTYTVWAVLGSISGDGGDA